MASLYKRGEWFWVAYYANGEHVQRALGTNDARIAKEKKKHIEYELSIGELQAASRLPIGTILQKFCEHLQATRTFKSCKNDVSRLRVFFGPICEALKLGIAGGWSKTKTPKRPTDQYADAHVKVELLEDVSPAMINQFIATRIRDHGWSPKTANSTRQVLHRLFVYATKHHDFRARDRRYPNPADGVERQQEAAPEIRFLSLQQVEEQLEALTPNPLMHAMVATYIYAGLRREEALFVIDISGSMGGAKIEAAKRALSTALHGLAAGDQFQLIAFDNTLEMFRPARCEYTEATLSEADAWIGQLKARGGTEMLPALQAALAGRTPAARARTILFITDGQTLHALQDTGTTARMDPARHRTSRRARTPTPRTSHEGRDRTRQRARRVHGDHRRAPVEAAAGRGLPHHAKEPRDRVMLKRTRRTWPGSCGRCTTGWHASSLFPFTHGPGNRTGTGQSRPGPRRCRCRGRHE